MKIREVRPSDINFIYATWLRSFRYGSTLGKSLTNTVFFFEYNKVIDNLLSKSTVLVACLENDEEIVFGYIVYEEDIIHYVFIKESFRQMGIAKMLVKQFLVLPDKCTHETFIADAIIKKYNLIYNPFLLYNRGLLNETKED